MWYLLAANAVVLTHVQGELSCYQIHTWVHCFHNRKEYSMVSRTNNWNPYAWLCISFSFKWVVDFHLQPSIGLTDWCVAELRLGWPPRGHRLSWVFILCTCFSMGAQRSSSFLLLFPACAAWPSLLEDMVCMSYKVTILFLGSLAFNQHCTQFLYHTHRTNACHTCLTPDSNGTRHDGSSACAASSITTVSNALVILVKIALPLNARVLNTISALFKIAAWAFSTCKESEVNKGWPMHQESHSRGMSHDSNT